MGFSRTTVSRHSKHLRLVFDQRQTKAATKAVQVTAKARRAILELQLLEDAERLREQIRLPHEYIELRKLDDIGQARFQGGISYTFILPPSGRIYAGCSIHRIGAHTQDHNSTAAGIALQGNDTTNKPTQEQEESLAWPLNHGVEQGFWVHPVLTGGHRDTKATTCPGNAAYPRIPAINKLSISWKPGTRPTAPKPTGMRVLTYGSKGKDVGALQTFLKTCSLYFGTIDESFGPATLTGLKAYQTAVALSPDDSCGLLTWAKVDAGVKPLAKPGPKPPASPAATGGTYMAKKGDLLSMITQRHGTTTAALVKLNGIKDANKINVGQKIKLPAGQKVPAPKPVPPKPPAKQYYTVKRGDALSVIAQRHKTTTAALVKLNGIKNANLITVGQRLRVKQGEHDDSASNHRQNRPVPRQGRRRIRVTSHCAAHRRHHQPRGHRALGTITRGHTQWQRQTSCARPRTPRRLHH